MQCECCDKLCPVHTGSESCSTKAVACLRRSDMEDETGTMFCESCANDAMESGVFFEEP
jgi:hypothetical protein